MIHIGLIENLNNASDLLEAAISRYTEACSAILSHFEPSGNEAQDLLDSVLAELPKTFDYEAKIQQAISFMYRIQNQSPSFVPINLLPPEIMTRIFWFAERCCLPKSRWTRRNSPPENTLVYPEVALEVCHRWRQIALASHDLWSHIDIDLSSGSEGRLFSRALAFAAHSNRVPIDLHLRIDFHCSDDQHMVDFCHSVAPRTRSLDLQCDGRAWLPDRALDLLARLFSGAVSGTLHQLRINAQPFRESCFLGANNTAAFNHSLNPPSQSLPLTKLLFEGILASITSLQLDGLYPYWTSRAYTGLIELDLDASQSRGMAISAFDLANVLRASPGIRILRFSLNMIFESGDSISMPDPVQLSHLETVQLSGRYPKAQETVLRIINPGQLPLELIAEVTEHFRHSSPSSYWDHFVGFISRSRVAQLHIRGVAQFKIFLEVSELFSLLPQLQVLTLCEVILGQGSEELLGTYDAASFLLLTHERAHDQPHQNLQLVHLSKCRIYWSDFRHMSEIHPTQTLKLDQCELVTAPPPKSRFGFYAPGRDATSILTDAIVKICPTVELKGTFVQFEEPSEFKLGSTEPDDDSRHLSGSEVGFVNAPLFGATPTPQTSAFGGFGGFGATSLFGTAPALGS